MKTGLRATLIREDGGEEKRITPCTVHQDADGTYVTVRASDRPDWMSLDADIVAATPDGSVEAAFVPEGVAIVEPSDVTWSCVPDSWTRTVAVYIDPS